MNSVDNGDNFESKKPKPKGPFFVKEEVKILKKAICDTYACSDPSPALEIRLNELWIKCQSKDDPMEYAMGILNGDLKKRKSA